MNRIKSTTVLYWGCVTLFFCITMLGYMYAGEEWHDAGYYSALLFAMNYTDVEERNIWLYVGRVLCPVMTVAGLLTLLKGLCKTVVDSLTSLHKDATALYYDEENIEELQKQFRHPILMGKKVNKRVKYHVLMMKDDIDNLTFYKHIEGHLKKGSKVYIKLEKMESCLLKNSKVYYFNSNEIIARNYWKERNLQEYLKDGKLHVKIALIGFGSLGQHILNYGLMKNIYSLNQSIQYHVWGDSCLYRNQLGSFDMMNGDTITYHDTDWQEEIKQLKEFDRIIVTQEPNVELLQALIYMNGDAEIDFYNPAGTELVAVYDNNNLTSFGILEEVLTEENIKTDKLYRAAKKVNFNYAIIYDKTGNYSWDMPNVEKCVEEEWEKRDSFDKDSNIAAADYHQIREMVVDACGICRDTISAEQMEMLKEMEHVRWCRYHFVNHWNYCDGDKKNKKKRRHPLLVPYAELPKNEDDKDEEVIRILLKNK